MVWVETIPAMCSPDTRAAKTFSRESGWLADAHQHMHQVFMILSKKCFDPAVCFWLVCLFKYFFSK